MEDIDFGTLRKDLTDQCFMFLAGQPVVYHCHHFNLFLDQTIDDALGPSRGATLRMKAAREFCSHLIRGVCAQLGATTPPERVNVATQLFRAMGHGHWDLSVHSSGGTGRGAYLHYGLAWLEKYGQKVRRLSPADAFAAGYAAATAEVAYDLPAASLRAEEHDCLALRCKDCSFTLSATTEQEPLARSVGIEDAVLSTGHVEKGINEDVIAPIAAGLRDFTRGVRGDRRGLIEAFGVFVTMHLSGYYNRISYDAAAEIAERAPQSSEVLSTLLRESGHVCVFNTFGGILLSPEWEGLVGAPPDDPETIVTWSMAIARALGFGRWSIPEFIPEKTLVLRTPSTYESVYYRTRHGRCPEPNEYMLQGAALATAQLAHRVRFSEKPELSEAYYQELFKGGVPWRAEQTKSVLQGDPYSEVVVTRIKS